MINWEGVIIENGTMITTVYPDGGGIPLNLTIPLLIILFISITIGLIRDLLKNRGVKNGKK